MLLIKNQTDQYGGYFIFAVLIQSLSEKLIVMYPINNCRCAGYRS